MIIMQLQRYVPKDENKGIRFGHYDRSKDAGTNFMWYVGENKIGMLNNGSMEADLFIRGFLAADDTLVLSDYPGVERKNNNGMSGVALEGVLGQENMRALVELLSRGAHAYVSSITESEGPWLLTFSSEAPPEELYQQVKPMPIVRSRR